MSASDQFLPSDERIAMMPPIFRRIFETIRASQQARIGPVQIGAGDAGWQEAAREGLGIPLAYLANTVGLVGEGSRNLARATTGAGAAGLANILGIADRNPALAPFAAMLPGVGPLLNARQVDKLVPGFDLLDTRSGHSAQRALEAWQTRGDLSPISRAMAANEGAASGNEIAVGLANELLDPMNAADVVKGVGFLANRGPAAARAVGRLGRDLAGIGTTTARRAGQARSIADIIDSATPPEFHPQMLANPPEMPPDLFPRPQAQPPPLPADLVVPPDVDRMVAQGRVDRLSGLIGAGERLGLTGKSTDVNAATSPLAQLLAAGDRAGLEGGPLRGQRDLIEQAIAETPGKRTDLLTATGDLAPPRPAPDPRAMNRLLQAESIGDWANLGDDDVGDLVRYATRDTDKYASNMWKKYQTPEDVAAHAWDIITADNEIRPRFMRDRPELARKLALLPGLDETRAARQLADDDLLRAQEIEQIESGPYAAVFRYFDSQGRLKTNPRTGQAIRANRRKDLAEVLGAPGYGLDEVADETLNAYYGGLGDTGDLAATTRDDEFWAAAQEAFLRHRELTAKSPVDELGFTPEGTYAGVPRSRPSRAKTAPEIAPVSATPTEAIPEVAATPARSGGPLADRIAQQATRRNLDRFMEGAHPLLRNEDGTPKRFYHGTGTGDFAQFDTPELGGNWGRGVYFSENPKYAGMYATGAERAMSGSDNPRLANAGPNIKAVYVNLKNPYIVGEQPGRDYALFGGPLGRQGATEQLRAAGYDGIIERGELFPGDPEGQINELVAFDPATQIKSATGNRGTYNPDDPSLTGLLPAGPSRGRMALQTAGLGGIGGYLAGDDESPEDQRNAALFGAIVGGLTGTAAGSRFGQTVARTVPELWRRGIAAQREAWQSGRGMSLADVGRIWKTQTTSTIRNLLQDELVSRLWLSRAGVRQGVMNENWYSLNDLYQQGITNPYEALPERSRRILDLVGKGPAVGPTRSGRGLLATSQGGYVPNLGVSLSEENDRLVKALHPLTTAKVEAGLSLASPLNAVPGAGVALGAVKGLARPFWTEVFQSVNRFTHAAARHAVFQESLVDDLAEAGAAFTARDPRLGRLAADGMFSPGEVLNITGDQRLADEWAGVVNGAIQRGEQRAREVFGDFSKQDWWERALSMAVPFSSWALRAYPRTIAMLAEHPGITLALLAMVERQAEEAKESGLPGYQIATTKLPETIPGVAKARDILTGGKPGDLRVNFLGAITPFSGELFAGGDEGDEPKTLYQQAKGAIQTTGFSFNPFIVGLAYALDWDYIRPGAMSRTAGIEQALPGPELPSLAHGTLDFIRQANGGTVSETTPTDRRLGQNVYDETGYALSSPQNAEIAAGTALPGDERVAQAEREVGQMGLARNLASLALPATVSAESDTARYARSSADYARANPTPQVDPAAMTALRQVNPLFAALLDERQQNMIPEGAKINRGVSRESRAYDALQAWEDEHATMRWFMPTQYYAARAQVRELLGLPPER